MRILLLLMVLVSLPVAAITMYTWEDQDGVVHYSDVPQPGAVAIEVDPVQGFAVSPLYRSEETATARDRSNKSAYDTFAITVPGQDEVFWNVAGVISVAIEISPLPQNGDTISLFFDGQNMSAPGSRRQSYVLNEVHRGTHTVRAVVNDRNGNDVQQTEMITFHVHQTSVR